jgi:O-antigen/teichoic acid export membrane protein
MLFQQNIQKLKNIFEDKNLSFVAKGSISTFLTLGLVQGLRFISGIIIGRYYGADASGKLTLVITVMSIAGIFCNFGIKDALQKLIPEYKAKYNTKAAYQYFLLGNKLIFLNWIVIAILMYCIAPYLAKYWEEPNLTPLFRWSALFVLPAVWGDVFFFSLKAGLKINTANITLIVPTILRIIILILLTYFFYNIYNPIYLHWMTLSLLPFLFTIYPIYKNFIKNSKSEATLIEPSQVQIFHLAFPMFITYFSFLINNNADVFMLKALDVSTSDVGIYKTVTNIALISATLLVALNTTVQPKITQLYYRQEMNEVRKIVQKSSKMIFWLSLPIYLLLFFLAKYIMQLYGSSFLSGTIPLMILVVGQFFNTACGPVAQLLNATGHHKQFTYISIFGAIVNILLNIFLIRAYGVIGASVASSISMIVWNVVGVVYIYQKFGFIIAYLPFINKLRK